LRVAQPTAVCTQDFLTFVTEISRHTQQYSMKISLFIYYYGREIEFVLCRRGLSHMLFVASFLSRNTLSRKSFTSFLFLGSL
jgi:hypothetical protein